MNCKRIQELIMTDSIDRQASSWAMAGIQNHLMVCVSCRIFAQDVQREIDEPLQKLRSKTPDAFVWQRIKTQIQENESIELLEVKNIDLLKGFFQVFKPYAVAFMFFVFLGFSLIIKDQWTPKESYINSLVSLDTQNNDEITGSIEKYFL